MQRVHPDALVVGDDLHASVQPGGAQPEGVGPASHGQRRLTNHHGYADAQEDVSGAVAQYGRQSAQLVLAFGAQAIHTGGQCHVALGRSLAGAVEDDRSSGK
jgi:hypothetical protein